MLRAADGMGWVGGDDLAGNQQSNSMRMAARCCFVNPGYVFVQESDMIGESCAATNRIVACPDCRARD